MWTFEAEQVKQSCVCFLETFLTLLNWFQFSCISLLEKSLCNNCIRKSCLQPWGKGRGAAGGGRRARKEGHIVQSFNCDSVVILCMSPWLYSKHFIMFILLLNAAPLEKRRQRKKERNWSTELNNLFCLVPGNVRGRNLFYHQAASHSE